MNTTQSKQALFNTLDVLSAPHIAKARKLEAEGKTDSAEYVRAMSALITYTKTARQLLGKSI